MQNDSALQTRIHNLSDEELLKMIKEASSYQPVAISIAREELAYRGGLDAIGTKMQMTKLYHDDKMKERHAIKHRRPTARVEKGKRWFKFVLLMVSITAGIKALFALGHPNMANKLEEAFIQFISGVVVFAGSAFVIGWLLGKEELAKGHSSRSKAPVSSANPDNGAVAEALKSAEVHDFDEDVVYSQALKEIESGAVEHAIWSRAFVEADGIDTKARALYIKLRVERMRRRT